MAMIASDVDNPQFTGATNPDSRLAVRFYVKPIKNEWETQQQGRPIYADVDFVEILVPGDNTTTIDQPVREDHKKRFPLQWAHFQNKHAGDAREIGTPLSQWPLLTKSQVEELRALKFYTVDSVANASDANIQKVGMLAGMSAYSFREQAQRFLTVASGVADANLSDNRVKAAELKAEELSKQLAENNAKIAAMQEQMLQLLEAKPKRGRKPKAIEE